MSSSAARSVRKYTVQEYLALERVATERHEYDNGEILAMSGGTFQHGQVATNVSAELRNRLRGKPCQALTSDVKVRIGAAGRYVYPDVSVVCGQPEFDPEDGQQMVIVNPAVVVEVLSLSTELYDRGKKFEAYAMLPSLREYVLVSQWEPRVETFFRHPDGRWTIRVFKGMETPLDLPSLEITIPLSEIYLNVQFQPDPRPADETSSAINQQRS